MEKINNNIDKLLCIIGIVIGAMLINYSYSNLFKENVVNVIGIVIMLGCHWMYIKNKYLWGGD